MVVGDLDLPALAPVAPRPALPPAAARLGRALQPGPRRQRRAEDDGHHHRPAGRLGLPEDVRGAALGHPDQPRRHRPRHHVRRLADREDHGHARSPSCSPSAASAPRPRAPSPCSGPRCGGIPVSTTHTITGAIIGVGATRRLSAVKWGVAGRIVWAWVLTIPISAAVSWVAFLPDPAALLKEALTPGRSSRGSAGRCGRRGARRPRRARRSCPTRARARPGPC